MIIVLACFPRKLNHQSSHLLNNVIQIKIYLKKYIFKNAQEIDNKYFVAVIHFIF